MKASVLRNIIGLFFALIATQSAHAAEKVRWVNDWLPSGDKAAVYIGVYKRLFEQEGLDVEILSGRGGADALTKVATGVADITAASISVLMQAKAQGPMPAKAIYSIYTKQPDSIITVEGNGIETLKDLTGKSVATATFSSSNVVWPLILKANDIDASKITLLKGEPAALGPMLASGKVPAVVSWITNRPLFEKAVGIGAKVKVIPWFDFGFQGYSYSLLASDKLLKERPDVVTRFVRAYRKAIEAGIADPKVAAESVKALAPEIDEAVAEGQWRASIPLMVNDVTKRLPMGSFDHGLLVETWTWVSKSLDLPAEKLDPETVVDRSFLK
jgi:NitT/TauT family transport system substrate-binding protein